jgi:hypothetical protein
MSQEDLLLEIAALKLENEKLKAELEETKTHLKKYTAPSNMKKYYENHKEELLEKMKKYKPTPEKIKEKNRKAYLKRKEKAEQEKILETIF